MANARQQEPETFATYNDGGFLTFFYLTYDPVYTHVIFGRHYGIKKIYHVTNIISRLKKIPSPWNT